jgi:hypothetical protein
MARPAPLAAGLPLCPRAGVRVLCGRRRSLGSDEAPPPRIAAGDDVQSRALGVPPVPRELDAALLSAAAAGLASAARGGSGGGGGDGGEAAASVGRLQAAARSLQPFCRRGGAGPGAGAANAEERAAAQRRTVGALLQQCAAMRAG